VYCILDELLFCIKASAVSVYVGTDNAKY
jgi:hypothetical protein